MRPPTTASARTPGSPAAPAPPPTARTSWCGAPPSPPAPGSPGCRTRCGGTWRATGPCRGCTATCGPARTSRRRPSTPSSARGRTCCPATRWRARSLRSGALWSCTAAEKEEEEGRLATLLFATTLPGVPWPLCCLAPFPSRPSALEAGQPVGDRPLAIARPSSNGWLCQAGQLPLPLPLTSSLPCLAAQAAHPSVRAEHPPVLEPFLYLSLM